MKNGLRNVGMFGVQRTLRGWILAGLMVGAILPALAQAFPLAWYQVGDGPRVDVVASVRWDDLDCQFLEYTVDVPGAYQISARVIGKYDPYLAWGLVAANYTNVPLAFTCGFSTMIMPIATANDVYASFSGSVTDLNADGVVLGPNQLDSDGDGFSEIATNWLHGTTHSTNAGVDVARLYSTPAGGARGHSDTIGASDDLRAGPLADPADPWTSLETRVGFVLSRKDIATVNGYFSIEPVPEPRTLLLLGSGLIGAALVGMRRRRFPF